MGSVASARQREIVRPRWRAGRIRQYKVRLPSTSGVDFGADAALVAVGIAFVTIGPQASLFGIGHGFLIVPAILAVLRIVFWARRPTATAR